jgi:hypothetical protein
VFHQNLPLDDETLLAIQVFSRQSFASVNLECFVKIVVTPPLAIIVKGAGLQSHRPTANGRVKVLGDGK